MKLSVGSHQIPTIRITNEVRNRASDHTQPLKAVLKLYSMPKILRVIWQFLMETYLPHLKFSSGLWFYPTHHLAKHGIKLGISFFKHVSRITCRDITWGNNRKWLSFDYIAFYESIPVSRKHITLILKWLSTTFCNSHAKKSKLVIKIRLYRSQRNSVELHLAQPKKENQTKRAYASLNHLEVFSWPLFFSFYMFRHRKSKSTEADEKHTQ